MKRLLFTMIIVSTMIITMLNSCSKDDSLPVQNTDGSSSAPTHTTLNLTVNSWNPVGYGVFNTVFFIQLNANQTAHVYVVSNGKDILINQPVSFMDGTLWAAISQTYLAINYRGNSQTGPYLNIKVVIE